jgi:hypothetical protein
MRNYLKVVGDIVSTGVIFYFVFQSLPTLISSKDNSQIIFGCVIVVLLLAYAIMSVKAMFDEKDEAK